MRLNVLTCEHVMLPNQKKGEVEYHLHHWSSENSTSEVIYKQIFGGNLARSVVQIPLDVAEASLNVAMTQWLLI